MGWLSLGRVVVSNSGTPVRATINMPTTSYAVDGLPKLTYAPGEAVMFQAADSNTGRAYIGLLGFTKNSTAANQKLATLAIPTNNTIPCVTVSIPGSPAAINAAEYYIDVAVNGEGVDVSILVP